MDDYCWAHERDEPPTRRAFRRCPDCGHLYTRWELWIEHVRGAWQFHRHRMDVPGPAHWSMRDHLRQIRYTWFTLPSKVDGCTYCGE